MRHSAAVFSAIVALSFSTVAWARESQEPAFEELPGTGLPSDVPTEPEHTTSKITRETPTSIEEPAPLFQPPSAAKPVEETPPPLEEPPPSSPPEKSAAGSRPQETPAPLEESAPTPPVAPAVATPAAKPVKKRARSPKGKTYKVRIWQDDGDSLSQIAQKAYGDRTKWKLIYEANKSKIKNPNKIYPKQRLIIPPADWQP